MENSKYTALSNKTKPNKDLLQYVLCNVGKDKTMIDWGAGKGRHTKVLRELGYKVWGYDPYNGKDTPDGYTNISNRLPAEKHDIIISAYVLNVIHKNLFKKEIILAESFVKRNGRVIHKVREDADVRSKTKASNEGFYLGKKGSIQRYIDKAEFESVGYSRNNTYKIYVLEM
jgi:hypothetical protein